MKKTLLFCLLALTGTAQAGLITFTMSGTASGFLGSTPYSSLTIIAVADTASVTEYSGGFIVPVLSETVQINGGPTATVTEAVTLASAFSAVPGITMSPLYFPDSRFGRYALNTNFSLSGTGATLGGFRTFSLGTTAGALTISSAGPVTFTAVLDQVPEPSTWTAFGLGLAFVVWKRRPQ